MDKIFLRKKALNDLKAFAENPAAKTFLEKELYQKLFASDDWKKAKIIGLTLSQKMEINTRPIIEKAWSEGKVTAIPKTKEKPFMDFYTYQKNDKLTLSKFGILEPNEIEAKRIAFEQVDLLLVPGLVFHPEGYRIGFGGGFYDYLLSLRDFQTVSLAFPFQLNANWTAEIFDQKVKKIITNGESS